MEFILGCRVVRGPGWDWKDQDGGEGHVGTVVEVGGKLPKHTVMVQWDTGKRTNYCVGYRGRYDLYLLDSSPAGVKHLGKRCSGCHVNEIRGARWQCERCSGVELCTPCYMGESHNLRHKFYRHDRAGEPPCVVGPRSDCNVVIDSYGFYPGARVVRGQNWEWKDQDGGKDKEGTIKEIRGLKQESAADRSVAEVLWDSGSKNIYRIGLNGKVDLKCIRAARGMVYYRPHLRVCGKPSNSSPTPPPNLSSPTRQPQFKLGDRVRVTLEEEILEELMKGHGGWNTKMRKLLGVEGRVHRITDGGDVRVQYPRDVLGGKDTKWTFNPVALELITEESGLPPSRHPPSSHHPPINQRSGFPDIPLQPPNQTSIHPPFESLLCREMEGVSLVENNLTAGNTRQRVNDEEQHDHVREIIDLASSGNLAALQRRVTSLSRIELLNEPRDGKLVMHEAVKNGHRDVIRLLLEKGVSMEVLDELGYAPIHHAIIGAHTTSLRFLLQECRADPNIQNREGLTPLHLAAKEGFMEGNHLLLERGADVNAQTLNKDTALHLCIETHHDDIAEELCQHPSIDLNLSNKNKLNPLHLAAQKGSCRCLTAILSANPGLTNVKTEDGGATALHLAIQSRRVDAANMIVSKSCDVNIRDDNGDSPLHVACRLMVLDVVDMLVTSGADIEAVSRSGFTCVDMAWQNSTTSVEVLTPSGKNWAQVKQVLSKHRHFSDDGKCSSSLLLTAYLLLHGALFSGTKCHELTPCFSDCMECFSRCEWKSDESSLQTKAPANEDERQRSFEAELQNVRQQLEELKCTICMDRKKDIAFDPCGHQSCQQCGDRMIKCHMCRKDINKKLKIYD